MSDIPTLVAAMSSAESPIGTWYTASHSNRYFSNEVRTLWNGCIHADLNADWLEAEREAHHQIAQTDGKAGDEQADHALHALVLIALALLWGMLASLPQSVDSREDEESAADILADVSQ